MDWRFWESRATRIAREAARWRVEMEELESQAQVDQFEAWLRADPAHHRAFEQSDSLASTAQNLSSDAATATVPGSRRLGPVFAMTALAMVFGASVLFLARPTSPAFAAITNRGDAVRLETLGDGSIATLDSGTAIEVAVSPAMHKMRLVTGRVRLAAHLPAGQSFTIATPATTIVATDCVLDVSISDGGVHIRLIAGHATFSQGVAGGNATILALDQAVLVRGGSATAGVRAPDEGSWTLARVGFDNERLDRILAVANATGDPKISAADPSVAALRVTAVLDLRDTRRLARKLAAALDLRVIERGDTLILSR